MRFEALLRTAWASPRVPLILQHEATECGLACLAMVAGSHGHQVGLAELRRAFPVSLRGLTLKSLARIADRMGLETRALRLSLSRLGALRLPCILHWDLSHFVVLVKAGASGVTLHDPAAGVRHMSLQEFDRHFSGVALEVWAGERLAPREAPRGMRLADLLGRTHGLRRALGTLLALGLLIQLAALGLPLLVQWVVDEVFRSGDASLLLAIALAYLLLVAVQVALSALRTWASSVLSAGVNLQWLAHVFAHLCRLPLSFFERRHVGDIVSRFRSIEFIQRTLTTQFVETAIDGLFVTMAIVAMALYSLPLTALSLATIGLYVAVRGAHAGRMHAASAEQIQHAAQQQTHLFETIRGAQTIRLFDKSLERRQTWLQLVAQQLDAELQLARLGVRNQTAQGLLLGADRAVVLLLLALSVLDARLTIGMALAFMAYKDQVTTRGAALVDRWFEWKMLGVHAQRVADIVLEPPEEEPAPRAPCPHAVASDPVIELRDVSFRYGTGDDPVLHAVSLRIPAGQCVVISGPSGAGKSTLLKILTCLETPTAGQLLVDGIEVRRLGVTDYRALVGTVLQSDRLFTGSVAENIAFFDPEPDHARVQDCAARAGILQDIERMPMRFHTRLGDGGLGISGGQRQRILLARALYKRPRILILDEATSHLDAACERLVNDSIQALNLTRIIVAHRQETLQIADRVVTIAHGRIVSDAPATGSTVSRAA